MTSTAVPTELAADFEPASREAWVKLVEKALKGGDFDRRMVSRTADGLRIEPLYTRADELPGASTALPGAAPFTRGTERSELAAGWDIRQFHSGADAKAVNAAILEDLEGGVTSIALHIASPGGSGLVLGEGTLAAALEGVLVDACAVSLIAGERAGDAAAQLIELWQKKKIAEPRRRGHFNADPLGTLAVAGALTEPIDEALSSAASLAARAGPMPGVTALVAEGNHYHAAGASEAEELAAMLATVVAYLRTCEAAGLSPDQALPKIAVSLAADADQFLSTAKLRAARRLLWRVAEAAGAGASAGKVHLTAVTAWRMLARRDPWTNIMRLTIACAGAAFGGASAITVLPFTFALGQPDSFARRVSRNIQLVLAEESNLGRVIDPAGGSWYVEKLTDELARKAWAIFQEIEAKGGMAAALQSGFVQDRIAATAEARAKAIATGRIALTGVSAFPLLGDDGVKAEPWAKGIPAPTNPATTIEPLKLARLAEPFERLRDAADAMKASTGRSPQVFLASLGQVIDHNVRSTWARNYLAAGGIETLTSDGYASPADAAAAFEASGAAVACICSSDALYKAQAADTAKALKAAGASLVLLAGRPGDLEAALKSAGVDQFLFAGDDAIGMLSALQDKLAGAR